MEYYLFLISLFLIIAWCTWFALKNSPFSALGTRIALTVCVSLLATLAIQQHSKNFVLDVYASYALACIAVLIAAFIARVTKSLRVNNHRDRKHADHTRKNN